jgi:hypothetical protein
MVTGKLNGKTVEIKESAARNVYYYCDHCGKMILPRERMHCADIPESYDFFVFCEKCYPSFLKKVALD